MCHINTYKVISITSFWWFWAHQGVTNIKRGHCTNQWIYITILWYSIYDYIILWPLNVNCKTIPQSLYIIKLWSLYNGSNSNNITHTFILIALLSGSSCFWRGLPFHLFKTKTKLNYDLGLHYNHNLYIDNMATLYIFVLSSIYF